MSSRTDDAANAANAPSTGVSRPGFQSSLAQSRWPKSVKERVDDFNTGKVDMELEDRVLDDIAERMKILSERCHEHQRRVAILQCDVEERIIKWEELLEKAYDGDEHLSTLASQVKSSTLSHRNFTQTHISRTEAEAEKASKDAVEAKRRLDEAINVVRAGRQTMESLEHDINTTESLHASAVQYHQVITASCVVALSIFSSIALLYWFSYSQ